MCSEDDDEACDSGSFLLWCVCAIFRVLDLRQTTYRRPTGRVRRLTCCSSVSVVVPTPLSSKSFCDAEHTSSMIFW